MLLVQNDSIIFFIWGGINRPEELDELTYMKELSSVNEPTHIQLGLL